MSDQVIQIPVSTSPVEAAHPGQGKTRLVPVIRTPVGPMLCIWQSHKVIQADVNNDGHPIPARECVLLVTREPLVTMRAEVDLKAWEHFDQAPVEW